MTPRPSAATAARSARRAGARRTSSSPPPVSSATSERSSDADGRLRQRRRCPASSALATRRRCRPGRSAARGRSARSHAAARPLRRRSGTRARGSTPGPLASRHLGQQLRAEVRRPWSRTGTPGPMPPSASGCAGKPPARTPARGPAMRFSAAPSGLAGRREARDVALDVGDEDRRRPARRQPLGHRAAASSSCPCPVAPATSPWRHRASDLRRRSSCDPASWTPSAQRDRRGRSRRRLELARGDSRRRSEASRPTRELQRQRRRPAPYSPYERPITSSMISSVPGADPVEAHVAPDALDAVLLHVAGAAVDLDALVGDLDGDARGVQLGHRDLAHGVLAVLEAPGRRVDHLARRLDLRRHLGELVADDLEVADRAAERVALLGVLERLLEAPLGAGDAARRADQPLALELPHDVVEALALLAQDRVGRHAHVLERQQRRVGGVHAELLAASSRG